MGEHFQLLRFHSLAALLASCLTIAGCSPQRGDLPHDANLKPNAPKITWYREIREPIDPFPEQAEITSMEASLFNVSPHSFDEIEYFPVPRKHWRAILGALLPAQRIELEPVLQETDGEVVGQVKIVTGDTELEVLVYVVVGDRACFHVGEQTFTAGSVGGFRGLVHRLHQEYEQSKAAAGP